MLDALLGELVEVIAAEGVVQGEIFEGPVGVEAEVDADVAVLVEAGVVERGAEADDTYGGGAELPEGIESGVVRVGGVAGGDGGVAELGGPEVPTHFELVGHIVVELLGGFGDGAFDDGGGGV